MLAQSAVPPATDVVAGLGEPPAPGGAAPEGPDDVLPEPPEIGGLPDLSGLTARQALARTASLGLQPVLRGEGTVRRQSPAAGTPIPEPGARIELFLLTGDAGAGG